MPMRLKSFRKWVQQVYATQDEELDCSQLFDVMPQYVDLEIAGEETIPRYREVKQHLDQCAECHDLYVTVRDAACLEHQRTASKYTIG